MNNNDIKTSNIRDFLHIHEHAYTSMYWRLVRGPFINCSRCQSLPYDYNQSQSKFNGSLGLQNHLQVHRIPDYSCKRFLTETQKNTCINNHEELLDVVSHQNNTCTDTIPAISSLNKHKIEKLIWILEISSRNK